MELLEFIVYIHFVVNIDIVCFLENFLNFFLKKKNVKSYFLNVVGDYIFDLITY